MLEQRIRIVSEGLARAVNRRTFIRQTGTAVVSGVAALAMGHLWTNSPVHASTKGGALVPQQPNCAPPGPYCNIGTGILTGCHGAHCYEHLNGGQVRACQVYYAFYPAGCWTATVTGGHWTCCDCQCSDGSTCGCAQFSGTPITVAE